MTSKLDHCNIRTFDIEKTVHFYTDILELRDGDFGGSRAMGAWLYDASDRPVVHLIAIDPNEPEAALGRVRERLGNLAGSLERASLAGGGAIDHIAFECSDYDATLTKVRDRGLTFTENYVPSMHLRQLFLNDPNGVTLELNFR